MKVKINGKIEEFNKSISLKELTLSYNLNPEKIVIEYNGDIPDKSEYEKIYISENDTIELIQFVGGG